MVVNPDRGTPLAYQNVCSFLQRRLQHLRPIILIVLLILGIRFKLRASVMIVVGAVSMALFAFPVLDLAVAFAFVMFMVLLADSAAFLCFKLFEFFTGS
jgi:hypothetical protein